MKQRWGFLRVITRDTLHRVLREAQAMDETLSALVTMTAKLDVCPVPLTEDPLARQLFSWEQTMETYGLPLVAGGIADQPQWFLDACSIIRSVRNKYQNNRLKPKAGETKQ